MENKPVFKSTMFGGFERHSVLNYIYETAHSNQEAQERLTAQIEEMSATRERLELSVKELEARLGEAESARHHLGEELQGAKVKNNELSAMLSSLAEEIDRQKAIVQEKDEQLRRLTQVNTELERKNADLERRASEFHGGGVDVDKAKLTIGELMVKSHIESEKLLLQTNIEAQKIIDQANLKAAQIEAVSCKSSSELFSHMDRFRSEVRSIEERLDSAIVIMREMFISISSALGQAEAAPKGFSRSGGNRITLTPHTGGDSDAPGFFRSSAE